MQRNNLLKDVHLDIQVSIFLLLQDKDLLALSITAKDIVTNQAWCNLFSVKTHNTKLSFDAKGNYKKDYFEFDLLNQFYSFEKSLAEIKADDKQKQFIKLFQCLLSNIDHALPGKEIIKPLLGALIFEKHLAKTEARLEVIPPRLFSANKQELKESMNYIGLIQAALDGMLQAQSIKKHNIQLVNCVDAFGKLVTQLTNDNVVSDDRWKGADFNNDFEIAKGMLAQSETMKQNKQNYNAKFSRHRS